MSINKLGPTQQVDEERLILGDECLFDQASAQPGQARWLVEPKLLQVPNAGAIALGRIPSITEIVIAFTALPSGIGCNVFSDDVLCNLPGRSPWTRGLADDAANFLDVVKEIVTNLQDLGVRRSIVAALQRVNPSISSVELNELQNPSSVVVGHGLDGKTLALDLSQESDGFRRIYAHLLAK